jgi:RNA polymerase sigma-70 factor (ECF subfamily)
MFGSVYPDLHRYFVRRLGPSDAEDAVADTLSAVLAKWPDAPGTLDEQRAWAFGFAKNKALEVERARVRHSKLAAISTVAAERDHEAGSDQAIIALDRARYLLDKLPEAEREAVYLTAVSGLSAKEAAQALDCSVSAITTRVSRGRARLKELLANE